MNDDLDLSYLNDPSVMRFAYLAEEYCSAYDNNDISKQNELRPKILDEIKEIKDFISALSPLAFPELTQDDEFMEEFRSIVTLRALIEGKTKLLYLCATNRLGSDLELWKIASDQFFNVADTKESLDEVINYASYKEDTELFEKALIKRIKLESDFYTLSDFYFATNEKYFRTEFYNHLPSIFNKSEKIKESLRERILDVKARSEDYFILLLSAHDFGDYNFFYDLGKKGIKSANSFNSLFLYYNHPFIRDNQDFISEVRDKILRYAKTKDHFSRLIKLSRKYQEIDFNKKVKKKAKETLKPKE